MNSRLHFAVAFLLTAPAFAQLPQPVTTLRAAPRASWATTTGVTGTPTQRRDNPGAASNDRLYVFGGRDGNANSTVHNALYEFNGTTWTLKTADYALGTPTPRGGACVAWNFTTNRLVVFGGDTGTGPVGGPAVTTALLGDTWEWDPVANAWADVTPVSGSPSPRRFASMTWEPSLGGMLMFGGDTAITPTTPTNETWLFLSGAWAQMSPTNVPPARHNHTVVTRTAPYNDVLLCGGIDESFATTTDRLRHLDVWTWSGANWTKISDYDFVTQTGTHPASASAAQAVYDPLRQKVVLQGGQGISVGAFTSSAATATPTNTTFIYGYFNPGTSQWEQYNGSPTNWTSEFDCITNSWTIFSRKNVTPALATWGEADPVIGRSSRFFAGFLPTTGKVYRVSGQPNGGTINTTEYQATPIASSTASTPTCTGAGGLITLTANNLPWLNATFNMTISGLASPSFNIAFAGFGTQNIPLDLALPGQGIPGCFALVTLDMEFPLGLGGGTLPWPAVIPNNLALVGALLNVQVASAELDGFGNVIAIGSSNTLAVTLAIRD